MDGRRTYRQISYKKMMKDGGSWVIIIYIWPIMNVIGYGFLSLLSFLVYLTENKKFINFFNFFKISFFTFLILYILVGIGISTYEGLEVFKINVADFYHNYIEYFFLILILNTLICYIFTSLIPDYILNVSESYFRKRSRRPYFDILCILYPCFPLIFLATIHNISFSSFGFIIENFFYEINGVKIGKSIFFNFIFFFLFTIFFWIIGKLLFKEKRNTPFKLMLSCLLFLILLPNTRVVYEKLYSKEYITITKEEYVDSLSEWDLKQLGGYHKYPELKNLSQTERNKILRKNILKKNNIKESDLKKKNNFFDIANYYFKISIVLISLILSCFVYLWFFHDKLANRISLWWQSRKFERLK